MLNKRQLKALYRNSPVSQSIAEIIQLTLISTIFWTILYGLILIN